MSEHPTDAVGTGDVSGRRHASDQDLLSLEETYPAGSESRPSASGREPSDAPASTPRVEESDHAEAERPGRQWYGEPAEKEAESGSATTAGKPPEQSNDRSQDPSEDMAGTSTEASAVKSERLGADEPDEGVPETVTAKPAPSGDPAIPDDGDRDPEAVVAQRDSIGGVRYPPPEAGDGWTPPDAFRPLERLEPRLAAVYLESMRTDGGRAFYAEQDHRMRDAASSVRPLADVYTADLHGNPDSFVVDGTPLDGRDLSRLSGRTVNGWAARSGWCPARPGEARRLLPRILQIISVSLWSRRPSSWPTEEMAPLFSSRREGMLRANQTVDCAGRSMDQISSAVESEG